LKSLTGLEGRVVQRRHFVQISFDFFTRKIFASVFHPKIPGNPRCPSGITGENPPVMPPVPRLIFRLFVRAIFACYFAVPERFNRVRLGAVRNSVREKPTCAALVRAHQLAAP
jgi:hypothetical protein